MKPALAALFILTTPVLSDLIAHVQTDKGVIDVILQYEKAPLAVANFMTLAKGERSSIDPDNGSVRKVPYYIGEKFFRVINSETFKIAQTGSGTGTNSGGPGFTFKDEFDPSLTHVPYVLSMANSGPNTNGSQIFFTGSTPVNHLDNVHTIFGLIPDEASRAVIDAVLAAGTGGSSITAVTFDRSNGAEDFDEFAQSLPTVGSASGNLSFTGSSLEIQLQTPLGQGDLFQAHDSSDLKSWAPASRLSQFPGIDDDPLTLVELGNTSQGSRFYNPSITSHPGSVGPSSLANRTFSLPLGGGTLSYSFDDAGTEGNATYSPLNGEPFGGPFMTLDGGPTLNPHSATIITDTPSLTPRSLLIKIGWDAASSAQIEGHHSTSYWGQKEEDAKFEWLPFSSGPCSATRPTPAP